MFIAKLYRLYSFAMNINLFTYLLTYLLTYKQDQRRATYCVNSTPMTATPAALNIEMRGIVLLSLAESPRCPVWLPVANYLPPPCRHEINQAVYVL